MDVSAAAGAAEESLVGLDGQPTTKSGLKRQQKLKEMEAKRAATAAANEARAAAVAAKAASAEGPAVKKVRTRAVVAAHRAASG